MLLDSVRLILNGTTSKNNDVTIFIQCFNCSLMDKVLTFSLVSQLFMKNFTTPLLAQETKIGLKLGGGCLRWGYPIKPGGFVGCVLCTVPKCLNPEFLGDGKNVCHIDLWTALWWDIITLICTNQLSILAKQFLEHLIFCDVWGDLVLDTGQWPLEILYFVWYGGYLGLDKG